MYMYMYYIHEVLTRNSGFCVFIIKYLITTPKSKSGVHIYKGNSHITGLSHKEAHLYTGLKPRFPASRFVHPGNADFKHLPKYM